LNAEIKIEAILKDLLEESVDVNQIDFSKSDDNKKAI